MIGPTPLLDFFKRGEIERDVRMLAAQGTLAPRAYEQLAILILLLEDKDAEIRNTAEATLDKIPLAPLEAFLARSDIPIGMREFFGDRGVFPAEIPSLEIDDPLIDTGPEFEERLALEVKAALAAAAEPQPATEPAKTIEAAASAGRIAVTAPDASHEAVSSTEPAALKEPAASTEPVPEQPAAPATVEGKAAEAEPDEAENLDRTGAAEQLAKMTFPERLKAAVKGTREMRAILIRDPNKMISSSVLSSPKVSESEVSSFAKMQNVSEDVLRIIANNRAWTKNYTVVLALTKNPKTPLAMSLNFMARLSIKDIALLAVDRNIPEALRIAARKKAASNRGGD